MHRYFMNNKHKMYLYFDYYRYNRQHKSKVTLLKILDLILLNARLVHHSFL